MYDSTKACVKLNNCISKSFNCNIGVRQGDNLSPLLFSLFINDFESFLADKFKGLKTLDNMWNDLSVIEDIESFLKLYVLLYADDTVIMAEDPNDLQLALNGLNLYCEQWSLKINVDKTKIIRFSKRRPRTPQKEFWLNNEKVEYVENYVYLGTTISFNGQYKEAIRKQIIQAERALFAIKSIKYKYDLPIDIVLDLFDKMILPILLYGCEIWGFENIEPIEIFYRKFLRYVLHLKVQTTSCMIYGEAGKTPLRLKIKSRMVCFWHKVTTGDGNKLSHKLLNLITKLNNPGEYESSWLKNIKNTLETCGMGYVLQNPELYNNEWLKQNLNLKLNDMYKQDWHSEIMDKSSCRIYNSFKQSFEREEYLTLLNTNERICISKFRCRNSKIPVVILGYSHLQIPYEERLCSVCNSNDIGDEYHYIIKCPALNSYRNRFLDPYYTRNPNMLKFVQLFQNKNFMIQSNLAKMIKEINNILS